MTFANLLEIPIIVSVVVALFINVSVAMAPSVIKGEPETCVGNECVEECLVGVDQFEGMHNLGACLTCMENSSSPFKASTCITCPSLRKREDSPLLWRLFCGSQEKISYAKGLTLSGGWTISIVDVLQSALLKSWEEQWKRWKLPMPSVDLLVVTHSKDAHAIGPFFLSIQLFWPHFLGRRLVVVDDDDDPSLLPLPEGWEVIRTDKAAGMKPYFKKMFYNYVMDEWSDADYIAMIDTDVVLSLPVTADLMFRDGKLIWHIHPNAQHQLWIGMHDYFMGNADGWVNTGNVGSSYDFVNAMVVLPIVVRRKMLEPFRTAVLAQHPQAQSMYEVVMCLQGIDKTLSLGSYCVPLSPQEVEWFTTNAFHRFWCHFCALAAFAQRHEGGTIEWVDWTTTGHLQYGVHLAHEVGYQIPTDNPWYSLQAARLLVWSLCRVFPGQEKMHCPDAEEPDILTQHYFDYVPTQRMASALSTQARKESLYNFTKTFAQYLPEALQRSGSPQRSPGERDGNPPIGENVCSDVNVCQDEAETEVRIEKFLLMDPQGIINSEEQVFSMSAVLPFFLKLAGRANRTLVVPPVFQLFDLPASMPELSKDVRFIDEDDLHNTHAPRPLPVYAALFHECDEKATKAYPSPTWETMPANARKLCVKCPTSQENDETILHLIDRAPKNEELLLISFVSCPFLHQPNTHPWVYRDNWWRRAEHFRRDHGLSKDHVALQIRTEQLWSQKDDLIPDELEALRETLLSKVRSAMGSLSNVSGPREPIFLASDAVRGINDSVTHRKERRAVFDEFIESLKVELESELQVSIVVMSPSFLHYERRNLDLLICMEAGMFISPCEAASRFTGQIVAWRQRHGKPCQCA